MRVHFSSEGLGEGTLVDARTQRCTLPCNLWLTPGDLHLSYSGPHRLKTGVLLEYGNPGTVVVNWDKSGAVTVFSWLGLIAGVLGTSVGLLATQQGGSTANSNIGALFLVGGIRRGFPVHLRYRLAGHPSCPLGCAHEASLGLAWIARSIFVALAAKRACARRPAPKLRIERARESERALCASRSRRGP